ncbi:MAG: glycosyltransferase [Oscillochloridaceae bacterium umkhey_bin13]
MRRVVLLGADFAPSSLPPALRLRFFANHLPAFGWQPLVLTTQPASYDWQVQAENEHLVAPQVRVIRTGALPIGIARRIGFGDIGLRSMLQHWLVLTKLALRREFDLLCIPVPPYMPMLLGRLIHAQFGIPYVIDYIDPWVTDYYWKFPPEQRPPKWPLANALSRLGEPFALRRVSRITGVSQGTVDGVTVRYPWLQARDGVAIPYGGEPTDFAYLHNHPRPNVIFQPNDGLIHICSTGRGGPDLFPALRAIFSAVRIGLERNPALFTRLRFHFVGTSYAPQPEMQILPLAQAYDLAAYVHEHPARIGYLDALQVLLDADLLLAVGSEEAHYTASKIFPYLLAQRPLLAVFHETSSVLEILRDIGAGAWVDFGPNRPIAQQAERVLAALTHCLHTPYHPPQLDLFTPYTTRAMTQHLAEVFDQAMYFEARKAL